MQLSTAAVTAALIEAYIQGNDRERRKASEKLHENRHEEIISSLLTTQLVSILNWGWPCTQEHPLGQGVLPQPRKHCSRLLLNCPALQLQGQGSHAREFLRLWLLLTSLSRIHCFIDRNAFSVPNTHKNSEKRHQTNNFWVGFSAFFVTNERLIFFNLLRVGLFRR